MGTTRYGLLGVLGALAGLLVIMLTATVILVVKLRRSGQGEISQFPRQVCRSPCSLSNNNGCFLSKT
jgi:hypothetical protein